MKKYSDQNISPDAIELFLLLTFSLQNLPDTTGFLFFEDALPKRHHPCTKYRLNSPINSQEKDQQDAKNYHSP